MSPYYLKLRKINEEIWPQSYKFQTGVKRVLLRAVKESGSVPNIGMLIAFHDGAIETAWIKEVWVISLYYRD